ncbi:AarF/UbiB family protein [Psittacicella melopsittaci]|nr:AarF/UbiB family protein [Psittacicella melopsittaci]
MRWLSLFYFWVPAKHASSSIGVRLRLTLEELGPIWIKLGQLLSIQDDFFDDQITTELKQLQEKTTPSNVKHIKQTLERDLQVDFASLLDNFSSQPLASASIAQVYAANLNLREYKAYLESKSKQTQGVIFNETTDFDFSQESIPVVIKILRPGVRERVQVELKLIRNLFNFIAQYVDQTNRLRGSEIVDELEANFKAELDLTCEAGNGQTLRNHWLNSHILYVPKIFCATKDWFISERIFGTSINNHQVLIDNKVDCELLAKRGVEIFFRQLLEFNFFHADMHPGNIFANINNPQDPTYIAIDFGIVGSLTPLDTKYLVENLIAFFRRDYRKIAELHVNSGWIRGKVDVNEFERQISYSLDPLFNKSLNEIRFSAVLKNLFTVARNFNMVVQPQLILLQKTLVYVEAMGRNVYPQLNLWETAKPILEEWFAREYSLKNQATKAFASMPQFLNFMSYVSDDMYRVFDNHQQILLKLNTLENRVYKSQKNNQRLLLLLVTVISALFTGLFFTLGMSVWSIISLIITALIFIFFILSLFV